MNCYNVEGIIDGLNIELDKCVEFKKQWENVTFVTKKDGKPFTNLGKNIIGAKISIPSYRLQSGENILTVYGQTVKNGYISDEINIYELVKYLKDDNKIAKTENYMPKQTYLEQVYAYDLDDIKAAITDRIVYFDNRIKSLTGQIAKAKTAYNNFEQAYNIALANLKADCFTNDRAYTNGTNDLCYAIKDTIVNGTFF